MAAYKTEQRGQLMDFLQRNPDRQFSAQQIAESLPAPKISLSAIYRNLTALEGAGFINRFTKEGSREIYYQYIQSEHCRDCIHLICMKCGKTIHMEPEITDRLLADTFETNGFQINRQKTVLYGVCSSCLPRADSRS